MSEIEVRRGRGRPPVGRRIEIRLTDETLTDVDAWAAEEGWTRAELIRWIVEQQFRGS